MTEALPYRYDVEIVGLLASPEHRYDVRPRAVARCTAVPRAGLSRRGGAATGACPRPTSTAPTSTALPLVDALDLMGALVHATVLGTLTRAAVAVLAVADRRTTGAQAVLHLTEPRTTQPPARPGRRADRRRHARRVAARRTGGAGIRTGGPRRVPSPMATP